MRRYLPFILAMLLGPILFVVIAGEWGPYGQFAASVVLIVPLVWLAERAGLMDKPEHR